MKVPNKLLKRIFNYLLDCVNHSLFWSKRWKKISVKEIRFPDRRRMSQFWLEIKSYPDLPSKQKDPNWRTRDDNWVVFSANPLTYLVLFRSNLNADVNFVTISELHTDLFALRVSEENFEITTWVVHDKCVFNKNAVLSKPICVFGQNEPCSTRQVMDYANRTGKEVTFI